MKSRAEEMRLSTPFYFGYNTNKKRNYAYLDSI